MTPYARLMMALLALLLFVGGLEAGRWLTLNLTPGTVNHTNHCVSCHIKEGVLK